MDPLHFPVFITVRDRLTDLGNLIAWLENAGHQRIVLIDNDSAYEPTVDYLNGTPHEVVRAGKNGGSRIAWDAHLTPADEWFVVTDPDIVPTEDCPPDLVAHLHDLLCRHEVFRKAGPALYLDDLPAGLDPKIEEWERGLVSGSYQFPRLEPGAYSSLIDTTFALHRPGTPFCLEAIRTTGPYVARHMGWYAEINPTAEDRFYLRRAEGGPEHSSWAVRAKAA